MTEIQNAAELQILYALNWVYGQDGKLAIDASTGVVVDANPAAEALMGYSRAELMGMQITMLHPEGEREQVKAEFPNSDQRRSVRHNLHIQHKDGHCVPVMISSSQSVVLYGRPVSIYVYFDTIVHEKEMKQLAKMEARYRGLLEAAPDGVVVVNQEGEIVILNARAEVLFGYRRDELIGQKVTNIIPVGFAERLIADGTRSTAEALAQQIGTGIELNGRRKDGSGFPIEIMLSPLENEEGILVTASIRDITAQKEREHRLTAQNWALGAYAVAALALGGTHSSEDLLFQAICKAITQESNYLLTWVGIAEDGPGKRIRVAAAVANEAVMNSAAANTKARSATEFLDGLHLSWSEDEPGGESITGTCIRTNEMQVVQDEEKSPIHAPWLRLLKQYGIRSSVAVPFSVAGRVRGALVVYAASPNTFEAMAIDVFKHLAEQIGYGVHAIEQGVALQARQIELDNTQKKLTKALSAMVAPIVLAMEMRDPYTAGHQARVAEIAVAIGKEMGWSEEQLQGLRVAAQVHDIGKISIPTEILTKPTQLHKGELALIHEHPETGYTILKDIPFAWPIAEIVRQHHEKLDGSGYPRGLKADEILLDAKILAVADIVDAMASNRPYRAGIPMDDVLKEIEKQAGTLLDAESVRICAGLIREKRLAIHA